MNNQENPARQIPEKPIPATNNDMIADTDLGMGPGNELGKYSTRKTRLGTHPKAKRLKYDEENPDEESRAEEEIVEEEVMSTDHEDISTRTDINAGESDI
jgi:hypothetical protein